MRYSDFKIVETNARLQKRLNDWMSQYVTWQEFKNQSTTTSMVGDKNITSPAFDKSMKDQKAQLDREAEFFRQNGFENQVNKFLNDMSKPMQRSKPISVPGIAAPKPKTKVREYGPHDRVAKVGNTTVRANTRTGKQSVNTKVGNLELDADNTLNKDGSQGRMSATYKKDKLKLKHDTRKGTSASYKMPDGSTAKVSESVQLNEGARIDHAEDIIFWEGSKGAIRALESLKQMEQGGHTNVTVKWDGSPALVFGRNEAGEFILTDKSGFVKKGGVERATSADDLANNLLNRSGGANKEDPKRIAFATNMKDIFDEYEKAVPADYRGYFKGDLLYYNTPSLSNGNYVFKPNIVEYAVDANSELGKRIGASKTGVVIHRQVQPDGAETPLQDTNIFAGNEVLVVPPISVEKPAQVDSQQLNRLAQLVDNNSTGIDTLLDKQALRQLQLSNFSEILYAYTNSKVDTGLQNLGKDFEQWLQGSKLSERKKQNVMQYIQQNSNAFNALWQTVNAIMKVKDSIIAQFDAHDSTVKQSIPGTGEGGEGYVLAHPGGDIKLVPREFFSKANRAAQR